MEVTIDMGGGDHYSTVVLSTCINKPSYLFNPESSRYLRIKAQTARELPEWHPKHGRREGLLFVDEIMVL